METKGLKFEELEAQEFGLLPDRVEMRRRRRRSIRNTAIATNVNVITVLAAGDDIEIEY
jgi:hypothetical protein